MTQTKQRKPQTSKTTHTVELAPNQIYIKFPGKSNPVQTLVEGYADWSYKEWNYCHEITLYYKGHNVTDLVLLSTGGWTERYNHSLWRVKRPDYYPTYYPTLADAVSTYQQGRVEMATIDRMNKEAGMEEWCIRYSFTPSRLSLALKLPPDDNERLHRLARFTYSDPEEFILEALYKYLAEVEEQFLDWQRLEKQEKNKQKQAIPPGLEKQTQSARTESEVQQNVSAGLE
jgi:predicted DNA-binding protein